MARRPVLDGKRFRRLGGYDRDPLAILPAGNAFRETRCAPSGDCRKTLEKPPQRGIDALRLLRQTGKDIQSLAAAIRTAAGSGLGLRRLGASIGDPGEGLDPNGRPLSSMDGNPRRENGGEQAIDGAGSARFRPWHRRWIRSPSSGRPGRRECARYFQPAIHPRKSAESGSIPAGMAGPARAGVLRFQMALRRNARDGRKTRPGCARGVGSGQHALPVSLRPQVVFHRIQRHRRPARSPRITTCWPAKRGWEVTSPSPAAKSPRNTGFPSAAFSARSTGIRS